MSEYWQHQHTCLAKPRGFHLITEEIEKTLQAMPPFTIGLVHLFLLHTSASISISENACKDVRDDLENFFSTTIPDNANLYKHTIEGQDDMPAHIKNVLLGTQLTIPIKNGQMALGQWQGIYLCEHRNQPNPRRILITAHGTLKK